MKLILATKSFDQFGGNTTYSLAGMYLQNGLADYGAAISDIEAIACFRGGVIGNVSLQSMFDKHHTEFLPTLPELRYLRKKSRVVLSYETAVVDGTFLERHGFLSADIFGRVLRELADRLHLIDSKLKRSDEFDTAGFHRAVADLVAAAPTADDELRTLDTKLDEDKKDRVAAMSRWDRLGIDWDDYHPTARQLLDDPFYWDRADDFAPHGNDTGADLLSDFRKWNRLHPDRPAFEMVGPLLRNWGIAPIDWEMVDEPSVRAMADRDRIALSITDESLVAVAFAAIKLRGYCDEETKRLALNALHRQRIVAEAAGAKWVQAENRIESLKRLAAVLSRTPDCLKGIIDGL